jgi:hypothetical protein
MLALALSGLVLYAISFAVHLHLHTLDIRRTDVEEARLARSILQMIANDLRGTIPNHEVDFSGLEAMVTAAAATAVEGAVGDALGDIDLGAITGGSGGGGSGGGGSGVSDGAADDDFEIADETLDDGEPGSSNTVDLAAATSLPPEPGLFGNMYQLQVDVSRVPRPDELLAYYNDVNTATFGELRDLPSDIKTVTYYVQMEGDVTGVEDDFDANSQFISGGLVRRSLDRQVTQYAALNGNSAELFESGDLIRPEIVEIQFLYFDGFQLVPEWDSMEMGGLPLAVQVTLVIRPSRPIAPDSQRFLDAEAYAMTSEGFLVYQLLVHLPLGKLIDPDDELLELEMGL